MFVISPWLDPVLPFRSSQELTGNKKEGAESGEYLFPTTKDLDNLLTYSAVDKNFPAEWAFEKLTPEAYWEKIVLSQPVVRLQLGHFLYFEKAEDIPYTDRLGREEVILSMVRGDNAFSLSITPIAKSLNDYLKFKVDRLFDGVPVSTLNRCPGCKKLFLNFTQREKKYCSRQCLWRISAENYRETHQEEYRTKMRKLMREKYVRKRKGRRVSSKATSHIEGGPSP
jgi:hypothetical protein